MEEARGPTMEGKITFPQTQTCDSKGTINGGREESPGQTDKVEEPDGTIQPSPIPSKKDAQTNEKGGGKDKPLGKSLEYKPPKKVVIHDDYPNQTIIIGGNLSAEYRAGLIKILRKHADAFAWTPADMTGIPRLIAEHDISSHRTNSVKETEHSSGHKKGSKGRSGKMAKGRNS
ncbi:hypothetical protein Tco_0969870 [Tanacetum coccineum]